MIAASEDFVMDLLRRARIVLLGGHERFAPPRAAGQPRIWNHPGMYGSSLGARSGAFLHIAKNWQNSGTSAPGWLIGTGSDSLSQRAMNGQL